MKDFKYTAHFTEEERDLLLEAFHQVFINGIARCVTNDENELRKLRDYIESIKPEGK